MLPEIYTAYIAGILIVLQIVLMVLVGTQRIKHRVALGDGGVDGVLRAQRRHGNLAENAAIFLVVLLLVEMLGAKPMTVLVLGGLFVIARLAHAYALSVTSGPHPLRAIGALMTGVLSAGTGLYLIYEAATWPRG